MCPDAPTPAGRGRSDVRLALCCVTRTSARSVLAAPSMVPTGLRTGTVCAAGARCPPTLAGCLALAIGHVQGVLLWSQKSLGELPAGLPSAASDAIAYYGGC